jgi:hypothetical protein
MEQRELMDSMNRYDGVYILPEARTFTIRRYGYDPVEYGAMVVKGEE